MAALARLAGRKLPDEARQFQGVLDRLAAQLKESLDSAREPKACARRAAAIDAVAKQITDADQKRKWLEGLAEHIRGKEDYTPPAPPAKAGKKAATPKTLRDPCADTIQALLKAMATPATQPAKS